MNKLEVGKEYNVDRPGKMTFRIRVEEVSDDDVLGEITQGVFSSEVCPTRRAGDGIWLSTLLFGIRFTPVG